MSSSKMIIIFFPFQSRVPVKSSDGGILTVLKTPPATPNDSKNVSPVGSRPTSRRGSRTEDTKTRLFGPPEDTPRKVKNLFKSSIFVVDSSLVTPKVITPKATKYTRKFTFYFNIPNFFLEKKVFLFLFLSFPFQPIIILMLMILITA